MENSKKHTPGPWKIERPNIDTKYLCITKLLPNGETCFVGRANVGLEDGEVNANAALMAAAPELLEYLEYFVNALDIDNLDKAMELGLDSVVVEARYIISKAKGGAE